MNEFEEQGFILKKAFFSKDQIALVLKSAQDVFTPHLSDDGMVGLFNRDLKTFINCGKVCQHSVQLHRLGVSDKIIDELSNLDVKDPVICTRPVLFFNSRYLATKEVYYKTPPHQDWRSMQGSLNSVVVWVPLMDIYKDLGAIEVVPGSHRRGLVAKDLVDGFGVCEVDDSEFKSVTVEAGDTLMFSAFLIHRSGDNITDRIRWSCHFRYNDLSEKTFIERGYPCPYTYGPEPELITPDFP